MRAALRAELAALVGESPLSIGIGKELVVIAGSLSSQEEKEALLERLRAVLGDVVLVDALSVT